MNTNLRRHLPIWLSPTTPVLTLLLATTVIRADWTPWFSIRDQTFPTPSTVSPLLARSEHVDLFAVGQDGRVYSTWWEQTPSWQDWFRVRDRLFAPHSTVTALGPRPGHIDLFGVGQNGRVCSTWWEEKPGWQEWFDIRDKPFPPGSTVTALSPRPGHIDLFAVEEDGQVSSTWFEKGPGWHDWFNIHDREFTARTTVTALVPRPEHIDLFAIGKDGRIYSTWWEPSPGWQEWFAIRDRVFPSHTTVSALAQRPGHVDLFAVGEDGHVYSTWWEEQPGWQEWFPIGDDVFPRESVVTALAPRPGHIDLFAIGQDGRAFSTWWEETSSWQAWFAIGDRTFAAPGMISARIPRADQIDLYAVGRDVKVYSSYFAAPGVAPVPGAPPAPDSHTAMNLRWDSTDDNGLPKNPKWQWQVDHQGQLPDAMQLCNLKPLPRQASPTGTPPTYPPFDMSGCTNQPLQLDTATDPWKAFVCSHGWGPLLGHANYGPATYEGRVFWEQKSANGADDDYNFLLAPAGGAGLTLASAGKLAFEVEFDSDETIDDFDTPWWNDFHQAVDDNRALIKLGGYNGVDGVVIGLLGLDCAHACATELHPVWGMALHVKNDPNDDTWAIFVRNWGNEGYCSHLQHYWRTPSVIFRLHGPGTRAEILPAQSRFRWVNDSAASGPYIGAAPDGVTVAFALPAPDAHGMVEGELHLRWFGSAAPSPSVAVTRALAASVTHPEHPSPEEVIGGLYAPLPSDTARTALVRVPRQKRPGGPLAPPTGAPRQPTGHPGVVSAVPDFEDAARAARSRQSLCSAFGGNIPNMPGACR